MQVQKPLFLIVHALLVQQESIVRPEAVQKLHVLMGTIQLLGALNATYVLGGTTVQVGFKLHALQGIIVL